MRVLIVIVVIALGLAPAAAGAQEAETLRKELEQMRQQFERAQQEYQRAIQSMSERLQRLEAKPPAAPAPSTAAPPATLSQAPVAAPAAPLTALDLARPREPFSLYQRAGTGQLLFDMGIAGDFVGNLTQRNVQKAGAGTFAGQENRFFPREVELSLFGRIDPYASAVVRFESGEEERGQETGVGLAEAYVTLLALPYGTQARFGQMRNRFGYSNDIHEHDLPWVDRPNVMRNFLGAEGLQEKGVEATIVPDLPFFLEALVGVFNGDNETGFGRGSLRSPLVTARLRTFFELSDTSALQVGLSGATGETEDEFRNSLAGLDLRYKYRPQSWLHPLLTITAEAMASVRETEIAGADRTQERFGLYVGAEVQPFKRWAGGVRYDWSEFPVQSGHEWAVEPYVTFWPSEFLRFRLAYKRTERSVSFDPAGAGGSGRIADEILFQGSFLLGAHPAHPF
jgi:type II secretory pathway pseudopilin PulG